MLTYRRNDPFQRLFNELERAMGNVEAERGKEENTCLCTWMPRTDIQDSPNGYVLRVDLPGMEQKDIHVDIENQMLTISGERLAPTEENKDYYRRFECFYGHFTRSFNLPREVNTEKIEASYQQGVLTLILPKREESKPRQISIKVG